MKGLVLIFLFCIPAFSFLFGQRNTWQVSGIVRDEQGAALTGVSIYLDGVFQAATDEHGRFTVASAAMPHEIILRYLGFYPQRRVFAVEDFQENRAEFEFSLVSQSPVLQEVVISAKPMETIIREDFSTDLFDFGFAGNNLLLLSRENKKYWLRLMEEDGQVLSQIQLPEQCRILHKSCVGNFHVVGERWAWEIAFRGNTIDTLPRYPERNFLQFVGPCVQESAGRYYFVQHGVLNQSLRYVVFENGEAPRIAFDIKSCKGMDMANEALADFFDGKPFIYRSMAWASGPNADEIMAPQEKTGKLSTVEGLLALSGYGDDQIYRISELENIRRDSVYAPLFKLNDTLVLFDHPNDRIVRFGPLLERTDIRHTTYHHEKGWGKLILQDVVNHHFYACILDNQGLGLEELDAWSGKVLKAWRLDLAPYLAEKFKVRNGLLYFIGQPDVNEPNKILYKMNIFAGKPVKQ